MGKAHTKKEIIAVGTNHNLLFQPGKMNRGIIIKGRSVSFNARLNPASIPKAIPYFFGSALIPLSKFIWIISIVHKLMTITIIASGTSLACVSSPRECTKGIN